MKLLTILQKKMKNEKEERKKRNNKKRCNRWKKRSKRAEEIANDEEAWTIKKKAEDKSGELTGKMKKGTTMVNKLIYYY